MSDSEAWYVVKQGNGQCQILTGEELEEQTRLSPEGTIEQWGPFTSQAEAIARRVGLIRAGKCQPV